MGILTVACLRVGGLRAEVKAERRTDEAGECRQELVEQLLGFVEVAMRTVKSNSSYGDQRSRGQRLFGAQVSFALDLTRFLDEDSLSWT